MMHWLFRKKSYTILCLLGMGLILGGVLSAAAQEERGPQPTPPLAGTRWLISYLDLGLSDCVTFFADGTFEADSASVLEGAPPGQWHAVTVSRAITLFTAFQSNFPGQTGEGNPFTQSLGGVVVRDNLLIGTSVYNDGTRTAVQGAPDPDCDVGFGG
ncbi:MAG: hypothetical protein D6736_02505 [Nitrospinota bacterium]|nr:MAG: hypothetical protein D6736_02505 [Nitrospinota bacterium]